MGTSAATTLSPFRLLLPLSFYFFSLLFSSTLVPSSACTQTCTRTSNLTVAVFRFFTTVASRLFCSTPVERSRGLPTTPIPSREPSLRRQASRIVQNRIHSLARDVVRFWEGSKERWTRIESLGLRLQNAAMARDDHVK